MINITINNEEVLSARDFTINEEMLNTSSTILNNLYPRTWEENQDYTSRFYYPEDYSKCRIFKDKDLIFCGLVKNTGNITLNPFQPKLCSLQILDFKALLSEGNTLDFVISNKTIEEAIQQVIDSISDYGFVKGNINIHEPDSKIGAYSTLNKSAYDVFQYLADISGARWTTRMIDENTIAIDFYDPALMPQGVDIEYTQQYFEENDIQDLSYSFSTRDYRNRQIVLSNQVYGSIAYNEVINANGYSRTFNTQEKIGYISGIIVGGQTKSVATNDEKNSGVVADFYYTPGNSTFDSNSDEAPYSAGTQITISYIPLLKGREIVVNNDEVNRISNSMNRNGVIARYENRNDILSSIELNQVAQTYMKYKGSAEITLKVKTRKNLWNIGEVVYFNAPINELKTTYMVKKKETNYIASVEDIFYSYEMVSNYNSENAINYFDNQRNKASGNIVIGDYIDRNIDIENSANIIFQNVSIVEVQPTDSNVLNCTLNAPLNN